jgi:thiol-disulfide isomerase/thioredoxin
MLSRASFPAMRQTLILIVLLAGVGALSVGGAYYRFVTDRRIAASSPASLPTSTSPKSGDAFIVHETPQPVPALSFIDSDGNRPSLAAFRGRTILLNIWATWCLPCREEMPALERLEAKLSGPEFEVVPLSIDRGGLPKVKSFYEEISLKALGMFVDTSSKASYALGAVGIPTALLINPDGLEVGRLVGPAEWDSPELTEIIQQHLQRAARKTGHD